MARTVETAGDGRVVRIDLRGRQRRSFLMMAAFCLVLGPSLAAGIVGTVGQSPGAVLRFQAIVLASFVVAAYCVRLAYGWVAISSAGLRTSRLLRWRSVRWEDVGSIRPWSYRSHSGGITVVRVHTKDGQRFLLPAPRTTRPWDDPQFAEALDYLRQTHHQRAAGSRV